jgi:hypothetical protein
MVNPKMGDLERHSDSLGSSTVERRRWYSPSGCSAVACSAGRCPRRTGRVNRWERRRRDDKTISPRSPILVGGRYLLPGARHVVPPHQDRFFEGHSADQYGSRRSVGSQANLITPRTEIDQLPGLGDTSFHLHSPLERNDCVLEGPLGRKLNTRTQLKVNSHVIGVVTGVRSGLADRPNENRRGGSIAQLEARKIGVMLEGGRTITGGRRLRHPQLGKVHRAGGRMLLGVNYSMAGSHQIEFSGSDRLLAPEAVAM